ncbi:MAG: FABP family protein [Bifidobacteriaceae bacterium]|jgi:hypothetical protein|nr:FABP family protein [Bifidobacteriaceae bacterium]
MFEDQLVPEVYPLAWLVGSWRGEGSIGYGPVKPGRIRQEVDFDAADGPYLSYRARTWLLPGGDSEADSARTGSGGESRKGRAAGTTPADPDVQPHEDTTLWHEEAGFWRVTPGQTQADPPFEIEVLISDSAGYQSLYLGQVNGPRVDLATDAVIRTASAPEVNAATRLYGLVNGDLLWAWDIAGFGHPLGSYMAAQLRRRPA